ncbi:MAG: hypothetical protein IE909_08605 [Campylobacterales bacterium]|nr:hypothetical protein [Campylobacterales bacterium]
MKNDTELIRYPERILDNKTAQRMKNILIKTVEDGTAKNAKVEGLEIGGKTGTAHIVQNERYYPR